MLRELPILACEKIDNDDPIRATQRRLITDPNAEKFKTERLAF
jgi:hypothetical protein